MELLTQDNFHHPQVSVKVRSESCIGQIKLQGPLSVATHHRAVPAEPFPGSASLKLQRLICRRIGPHRPTRYSGTHTTPDE